MKSYSKDMIRLNQRGVRTTVRPSGHNIKSTFDKIDAGGSIPSNVVGELILPEDMLRFGNNYATDSYARQCKEAAIPIHPARFPTALPEFFIKLLTDDGDVVLDPFAGSNTSGAVSVTPPSRFGFAQIAAKYPGTAAVPPHEAHGRRATPMGGPAQRIAEAEPPGSAIPIWQQTGVINDEG